MVGKSKCLFLGNGKFGGMLSFFSVSLLTLLDPGSSSAACTAFSDRVSGQLAKAAHEKSLDKAGLAALVCV